MPPSKKRRSRTQPTAPTQQLENDPSSPDRVDEFATMYPAFCTAPIPVEILDELIDEAKKGVCGMVEGGSPGDSLCILDTKDLDSIVHGSRKPMQPFESPFIGMTDDQVRSWMNEHRHPSFAYFTFAVLDEDTAKNKTCRIGCTDYDAKDGDKMLIYDFYTSLYIRVPIEVVTISWCEEVYLGDGKIYDPKRIEEEKGEISKDIASESQAKSVTAPVDDKTSHRTLAYRGRFDRC